MTAETLKLALQLLKEHKTLTLATYADGRPWAASLYFVQRSGDTLNEVSSFCTNPASDCEVRIRWDSDTPWYETQDLQGWGSGSQVRVEPFQVEAMFDKPQDDIMPSDHNGLLLHYRLSWAVDS